MTGTLFGGFKVVDAGDYLRAVREIAEINAAVLGRKAPPAAKGGGKGRGRQPAGLPGMQQTEARQR